MTGEGFCPVRVLQVSDGYPPATGGTERVVASPVTRSGHQGAPGRGRHARAPRCARYRGDRGGRRDQAYRRVHPLLRRFAGDPGHYFHPTFPDPLLVRHLQKLVDDFRPDIVHAHGWILNSCLGLRLSGAAMVTTLHDYGLRCANKTLISFDRLDDPCAGPSLGRCLACTRDHYGTLKGTRARVGAAGQLATAGQGVAVLPDQRGGRGGRPGRGARRTRLSDSILRRRCSVRRGAVDAAALVPPRRPVRRIRRCPWGP